MKKLFLGIFISALIAGSYFLIQNYQERSRIREVLNDTEEIETPENPNSAPTECANETDRVQLMDSEKCIWQCSSFYTAPTEERCVACKGVVVPQKCPMCPALCRPSFWNWEKIN